MKGIFKLLLQYVFASESVFFIILMPLILFGIMGEAMIFGTSTNIPIAHRLAAQQRIANSFIAGISGTTIISSALFLIPITIVDFKNSVLMKRIGATNIKPYQFLLMVVVLFIIQSSFSFFYSRIVATLIFGHSLGWNIAFLHNIPLAYLYAMAIMLVAISLGMVIASISETVRQVTSISNIVFFPISVLSGGLIPASIIYSSTFLKSISWINPFKYAIEPYLQQQQAFVGSNYSLAEWQHLAYPFIIIAIISICVFIISKKLKWAS